MSDGVSEASDLMGRNEYARHRGCAANAVKKAEDSGRIKAAVVRDAAGAFVGINWRLADQLWALNTDPAEAAKSGQNPSAPIQGAGYIGAAQAAQSAAQSASGMGAVSPLLDAAAAAEAAPAVPASGDGHGYLEARAKREEFQAKQAELNYLERVGSLTATAGVRREAIAVARQVRNAMLAIPDRVAPVLDPANPSRAHKLLTDEITKALRELSAALEQRGAVSQPVPRNFEVDAVEGDPVLAA